jgi:transposase-like protein
MDPQIVFCPNPDCPARGKTGAGNIGIHSLKDRRYKCHVCDKTFAETRGTAFYRLRTAKGIVTLVLTLLAHGCPIQAIVAAFGLDERTVVSWQERAGQHCQGVHQHLVEHPRALGHVQADEIRVKAQGSVLWLAMAVQVSTRLWLGGVLSAHRDMSLIATLMRIVRAGALCRPLLFCVDGCPTYIRAIRGVFREPIRDGQRGRPQLRPWDGIYIAQVVKQYVRRRVVGVTRRIVQGTGAQVEALLRQTQSSGQINTAYIERLNGTFRSRIAALVRRGRALVRQRQSLHCAMYLMGSVYNLCTYHESLRVPIYLPGNRHRWACRTPAIAAGITDHLWAVQELLSYRVPLPPWTPPKQRGRPSNAMKALVARWCA